MYTIVIREVIEMKAGTPCELDENKICDECGDCERCDLDPTKICDNCGACLDEKDFVSIKIDKIYQSEEEYENAEK